MGHGHWFRCGTTPIGLIRIPAQCFVLLMGSTTHCPTFTMSAMSACRKSMWSWADLCGPLFRAALSCAAVQGRVCSTTGTPRCRYWHRRPLAGWCTCDILVRSPWPLFVATNCSMPTLCTTTLSIQINSPSSLFICFLCAIMSVCGGSHLLLGRGVVVAVVVERGLLEMVGCGSELLISSLPVPQSFQCSLHQASRA